MRLRHLLEVLEGTAGAEVRSGPEEGLARIDERPDVLLIATRAGDAPYDETELEWTTSYVRDGGGVLLLANHGDLPGKNANDHASQDAVLAARFGVQIEVSWFQHRDRRRLTWLPTLDHPTTMGPFGPVQTVVVNNCSSIQIGEPTVVVPIGADMADVRDGRPTEGRALLVAAEPGRGLPDDWLGRVVVGTDSGFLGSRETVWPGPGLLDLGDNATLVANTVAWLAARP